MSAVDLAHYVRDQNSVERLEAVVIGIARGRLLATAKAEGLRLG